MLDFGVEVSTNKGVLNHRTKEKLRVTLDISEPFERDHSPARWKPGQGEP